MLRTRLILCSLVFVGAALSAVAMRDSHQEPQMPQPTEEHAEILRGAGSWEGTMKAWMPGMPESSMSCKEENVAFGPFWLVSTFECDFMGMPYRGQGSVGYDPMKQKYVGTWYDNMSPTLAVMEGEEDAAGKLTMRWTAPTMDGSIQPHRYELVHQGDSYVSTFFVGEGAGTKTMEMHMKRKGAAAAK
jgi:hypothetical protein